ncbi:MAG: EAL domain-containing protein [Motiliproteus sp.]|nr:EAL domain-containing protein [Motiliproteus sp.]MCW9053693.1 EAL domain-containing protein [Motiliproteus sp.]
MIKKVDTAESAASLLSETSQVPVSIAQLDQILGLQQRILQLVADDVEHLTIISKLCLMAEELLPNCVASLMLVDSSTGLLNVVAAPSIPAEGIEALKNLQPGEGGGSCGNAVYCNQPTYVSDTFNDPRWANLRQLAYDFNLCACWSVPIRDLSGEAIGSFALSSFEHRQPSEFHKRLLEMAGSITSIVLHKQEQNSSLTEKRHRLEVLGTALRHSSDGVIITDADNNILETNHIFESVMGYSQADVVGENPRILSSGEHSTAFYQQMWQSISDDSYWNGELINRSKDGELLHLWSRITRINDAQGEPLNYVAVFSDLTEIKRSEEKLIHALEFDQLTALPNKSTLSLDLNADSQIQTLVLLDMNNFSFINLAYGLPLGDKLLQQVAKTLAQVQPTAKIYRINADEFALLYPGLVNVGNIIYRIQHHFFSQQIQVDNLGFNVTFNYGASSGQEHLFSQALVALKKAKELGKNRYHIFDVKGNEFEQEQRLEHVRWNSLLHEALRSDALQPYYQGIRNNKTGEISHYEALARLDLEGTVYTPFQFLKAARLSGLLPAIAQRMIDQSFALMADNNHRLSINITEEDLNQNYLRDYLQRKAQQYSIAPERVTLEILEGISAGGKKNHINQLRELKARGYQLAIDDFGTEYSNFERILELEVDYLKIDARYIKNIDTDKTSYEITRAIVYFAHNANIPTIAEFVHSPEVQAIVEELGIEYSQGYLFSEPSPTL